MYTKFEVQCFHWFFGLQRSNKTWFSKIIWKVRLCSICDEDTNLSFIITSEIARVYLNEFKRKYTCKLWTWFMN